jgi:hypothetical protein
MKRLIAAAAVLAVTSPAAVAASHFLKVSPSAVKAGKSVTLSGSVDHGCQTPGQVTIYSKAFKGATTHDFAGVPAVYATADKNGKFSKKITVKKTTKAGSYHVGGRCGGGNFGSATLKVT